MSKSFRDRVKYYSKDDLSIGENLRKSEKLISQFNSDKLFDINDIIELFQVRLLFENGFRLNEWSNQHFIKLKQETDRLWKVIQTFWTSTSIQDLLESYHKLEFRYKKDFWELMNRFKKFKQISSTDFCELMERDSYSIRDILEEQKIVKHFSNEIRQYLLKNPISAELILREYEEDSVIGERSSYHFPASLTKEDIETIVLNYLNLAKPNLNYVRLVVHAHSLKLSAKTKLLAQKKERELNDEILKSQFSTSQELSIGIEKNQIEPLKKEKNGNSYNESYSLNFLESQLESNQIFSILSRILGLIDHQGCINLVSKLSEVDPFELTLMKAKKEYLDSWAFGRKNTLALLRLKMYQAFLSKKEITVEGVLREIANDLLFRNKEHIKYSLNIPSEGTTYQEKIRILSPELEFLLKQHRCLVDEGEIDLDLIRIDSTPFNFGSIKSLCKIKYAYGKGKEFNFLVRYFYGSNSLLYYIEPFKDKYDNLAGLLMHEDVKYESYDNWMKRGIDDLIEKNYLRVDQQGHLEITDNDLIVLVGLLHKEGVINYWRYPLEFRKKIAEMHKTDLLEFSDMLFTKDEAKYFNFHLNKKEFTNGYDIRNRYAHGTNTDSEGVQERHYLILLKLMIMVIYKIHDDLLYSQKALED